MNSCCKGWLILGRRGVPSEALLLLQRLLAIGCARSSQLSCSCCYKSWLIIGQSTLASHALFLVQVLIHQLLLGLPHVLCVALLLAGTSDLCLAVHCCSWHVCRCWLVPTHQTTAWRPGFSPGPCRRQTSCPGGCRLAWFGSTAGEMHSCLQLHCKGSASSSSVPVSCLF